MPYSGGEWVDHYPPGSEAAKLAEEHARSEFLKLANAEPDQATLPDDAWELAKRDLTILPEDRVARDRQLLDSNPLLLHQTPHGNCSGMGPRGQ